MRWSRSTPDLPPAVPRLDRERDALVRLIESTPNATMAEMARIRLRAATFAAEHATPTTRAVETAAARDAAGEPIEPIDLPHTYDRAVGGHLVDIGPKLPSLSGIAQTNTARYEKLTQAAWAEHARAAEVNARGARVGAALVAALPTIESCPDYGRIVVVDLPPLPARPVDDDGAVLTVVPFLFVMGLLLLLVAIFPTEVKVTRGEKVALAIALATFSLAYAAARFRRSPAGIEEAQR